MHRNTSNNISFDITDIVSEYIRETKNSVTRTEPPLEELTVDIDFDAASLAWHQNKKKLNDCTYKYICSHCFINKRKCGRVPLENSNYCKDHIKLK
jgi:hypothetical protein